jgi:chemotaxis-related protein WspB
MLFLLFQLGRDRYVLDVAQIAQVLPLVSFKQIPLAPIGVAGVFNYRGMPVPAIDLSQLAMGRPAHNRFSTRIILVHYRSDAGQTHLLGLVAEKVKETVRREAADFVASGVSNDAAPYLGPVAPDAHGLLQWIEVNNLLPAAVRDLLFKQPAQS